MSEMVRTNRLVIPMIRITQGRTRCWYILPVRIIQNYTGTSTTYIYYNISNFISLGGFCNLQFTIYVLFRVSSSTQRSTRAKFRNWNSIRYWTTCILNLNDCTNAQQSGEMKYSQREIYLFIYQSRTSDTGRWVAQLKNNKIISTNVKLLFFVFDLWIL